MRARVPQQARADTAGREVAFTERALLADETGKPPSIAANRLVPEPAPSLRRASGAQVAFASPKATISLSVCMSSALVASSRISTAGSARNARANATS